MRTLTTSSVLAFTLFFVGCGSDTHESLAKESLAYMNEFAEILEGVNDVDSAKAAGPKLEALGEKFAALKRRSDILGEPTPEQKKAIQEKFEKELYGPMFRLTGASMKIISNPEIKTIMEEPMKKIQSGMR